MVVAVEIVSDRKRKRGVGSGRLRLLGCSMLV